jgi:UDP-N-acetylglucosamine pyrophosphorylase
MSEKFRKTVEHLLDPDQVDRVCDLVSRRESTVIEWDKVAPLNKDQLVNYFTLEEAPVEKITEFLGKIAVVYLFVFIKLLCVFH